MKAVPGPADVGGARALPRGLAAMWAVGVVGQGWTASLLTIDNVDPRFVVAFVLLSAVITVVAFVSARLSPARWGERARPLAAAELVVWLVLALVACALLVILPLLAPWDEAAVRQALAWSSWIVPAVAGVAALRCVRQGRPRTAAWRSGWALVLTLAGAVVVLVLTRLA